MDRMDLRADVDMSMPMAAAVFSSALYASWAKPRVAPPARPMFLTVALMTSLPNSGPDSDTASASALPTEATPIS